MAKQIGKTKKFSRKQYHHRKQFLERLNKRNAKKVTTELGSKSEHPDHIRHLYHSKRAQLIHNKQIITSQRHPRERYEPITPAQANLFGDLVAPMVLFAGKMVHYALNRLDPNPNTAKRLIHLTTMGLSAIQHLSGFQAYSKQSFMKTFGQYMQYYAKRMSVDEEQDFDQEDIQLHFDRQAILTHDLFVLRDKYNKIMGTGAQTRKGDVLPPIPTHKSTVLEKGIQSTPLLGMIAANTVLRIKNMYEDNMPIAPGAPYDWEAFWKDILFGEEIDILTRSWGAFPTQSKMSAIFNFIATMSEPAVLTAGVLHNLITTDQSIRSDEPLREEYLNEIKENVASWNDHNPEVTVTPPVTSEQELEEIEEQVHDEL